MIEEKRLVNDGKIIVIKETGEEIPIKEVNEKILNLWKEDINRFNADNNLLGTEYEIELYFDDEYQYHYTVTKEFHPYSDEITNKLEIKYNEFMDNDSKILFY